MTVKGLIFCCWPYLFLLFTRHLISELAAKPAKRSAVWT